MTRTILASLLLIPLAACGGGDTDSKSTTKLDAVEVQPGSISDSMIVLDDAVSDGTAVDNSVPDDGSQPDADASDDSESEDEASADSETEGESDPDAVDIPIAKKTIMPDSTAKKGE